MAFGRRPHNPMRLAGRDIHKPGGLQPPADFAAVEAVMEDAGWIGME